MITTPKDKDGKHMAMNSALVNAAYGITAAVTALAGVIHTYAQAAGIALDGSIVTGAKAGLTDSASSLTTTLNNQYLGELALMFVGFAIVCGVVLFFVKGHRRI